MWSCAPIPLVSFPTLDQLLHFLKRASSAVALQASMDTDSRSSAYMHTYMISMAKVNDEPLTASVIQDGPSAEYAATQNPMLIHAKQGCLFDVYPMLSAASRG